MLRLALRGWVLPHSDAVRMQTAAGGMSVGEDTCRAEVRGASSAHLTPPLHAAGRSLSERARCSDDKSI